MKHYCIAFLLVFLSFLGIGQNKEKKTIISFEYYTHDFGIIKEEGGPVTYEFEFKNAGTVPLTIKSVQAGCGCTVPSWPKEPIMPKSTSKILVEFNPFNKPGPFSKTLTVYSNSTQEATILTLMGKITPKPRLPSDDFPDDLGNLRFVSRYLNFGDVTTEKPIRREYYAYNQSDTSETIDKLVFNSQFLKVDINPRIIASKTKTRITVEFDPNKRNEYGYVHDKIDLVTNDKVQPVKSIYIAATISKYFPPLSAEEKGKVPRIRTDKSFHDFGTIKQGDKVTTIFTLKNEGADNLIIYKVKPSCGCTIGDLEKKVLTPGEDSKLTITFDSAGKEGIQDKHINIYCNDPNNFNVVLSVRAKISK